ncbi:serine dehydratase subunit alpha family protein [Marvinbryantia formatexigens]|nr:L-serine ammonia-lyase, iron-sulfur-dependent, subunit alpha [Marvinbryantia formatexigens]UWO25394.1 L-serine ammonia-lyase, iron-sulfur-dependent, subunit alpha [Marvinbryantia formatexigens DSM 14469]SDG73520.1 L-cysteine desulfidase [Marvinbryantia formatexigens]
MKEEQFLSILKSEIAPAVGCTEPVAIAYAAAKARTLLEDRPDRTSVIVSRNILKNAMGVGIPGTDEVGLEMAAAMGVIGGNSDKVLEVLEGITPDEVEEAKAYARSCVSVSLKDTPQKLYIEVRLEKADDSAVVVIEGGHTNITKIQHGSHILYEQKGCREIQRSAPDKDGLTIENIYEFISNVDIQKLDFLDECVRMNWTIAQEGLFGEYGLGVGKSIYPPEKTELTAADLAGYTAALAAAAADARMSGSTLPVMTVCGSGNQGITATLPVIGAALVLGTDHERMYRALALSCLVTIHVKQFIGKLSPLCGCGMGSSIGACCAFVYLQGGALEQIRYAVNNMTASVSGIICDGAKSGCALKVASVISSACQCAALALKDHSAGSMDGIVSSDVESTIRNLGVLGSRGMADTDQVILDMMICK